MLLPVFLFILCRVSCAICEVFFQPSSDMHSCSLFSRTHKLDIVKRDLINQGKKTRSQLVAGDLLKVSKMVCVATAVMDLDSAGTSCTARVSAENRWSTEWILKFRLKEPTMETMTKKKLKPMIWELAAPHNLQKQRLRYNFFHSHFNYSHSYNTTPAYASLGTAPVSIICTMTLENTILWGVEKVKTGSRGWLGLWANFLKSLCYFIVICVCNSTVNHITFCCFNALSKVL